MKRTLLFLGVTVALLFSGCGAKKRYAQLEDLHLESRNYPNPKKISNLSFALVNPVFEIKSSLSKTLTDAFKKRLQYDAEHISCQLTDELHKIILSKGFTITQIFRSYNDMTFTEKRNTSALFYPEVIIEIEENSMGNYKKRTLLEARGEVTISARVNIVMLEPLSKEKIWLKSVPVKKFSVDVHYKPIYKFGASTATAKSVPINLEPVMTKIDRYLEKIYIAIIEATDKYVERDEFEYLNDDIKRLKGIKRY